MLFAGERPGWVRTVYFVLLLTVITTTVCSWLNLTSFIIFLLIGYLFLTQKPIADVKTIFSNKLFLGFFALFVVECLGLLYTDHTLPGWRQVEKKSTLLALPFIISVGPFSNYEGYKKIMNAWCIIIFITTIVCLASASRNYFITKDITVFFYHDLVSIIEQNAIVFSEFVLFGLLFLLQHAPQRSEGGLKKIDPFRAFLAFWFIGFIILLASKFMLFLLAIVLIRFFFKVLYPAKKSKRFVIGFFLLMGAAVLLLVLTNNPIKKRYQDIARGNIELAYHDKFTPDQYFNGVQYRILVWRFVLEILDEKNAWLLGVSPGDSQLLLDQKYVDANMYIGAADRKDRGFLNYDAHNQFLQQLYKSGILGLAVFLVVCVLLIRQTIRIGTMEAAFNTGAQLFVMATGSMLEMQHGLFLFAFFPFLLAFSKPRPAPARKNMAI